jgi:DNA-binding response OmpR family regulator
MIMGTEIVDSIHLSALIIDDSPIIRLLLKRVLSSYSIESDEARDGSQAIELFERRLQAERPYDLICLDFGLPKMDGGAVLHQMRSIEKKFPAAAPAYTIVVTADDSEQTVKGMLTGGANAYILKPVDRDALAGHIERICRQKSGGISRADGSA